jgi:hypothetical protein
MSGSAHDVWRKLAALTPARIGLGRAGTGLPTSAYLKFSMAHAAARDAVHAPFDAAELGGRIESLGFPVLQVASRAASREVYLRRPDFGRWLDEPSLRLIDGVANKDVDLVIVVCDGLSSTAITGNAVPMLEALRPHIKRLGLSIGPVIVAREARVALGDEIGERPRHKNGSRADWRAAGLVVARQPGDVFDVCPARWAHRRGTQLHFQHPPGRADIRPSGFQAGLADRGGLRPSAHRREPQRQ